MPPDPAKGPEGPPDPANGPEGPPDPANGPEGSPDGSAPRAVLITRPRAEGEALASELMAEGIACLLWPLTRIRSLPGPHPIPEDTQGLLFTSARGVAALAAATSRRDLPALCVGARTARAAREAGFARSLSADGDAQALAALARGSGLTVLFHPTGRDRAADMPGLLAPAGIAVHERVLYAAEETGPAPPEVAAALADGRIGLVTLWSRRNAAILARRIGAGDVRLAPGTRALAISPAAAEPLAGLGFAAVLLAGAPDGSAMGAAIRQAL